MALIRKYRRLFYQNYLGGVKWKYLVTVDKAWIFLFDCNRKISIYFEKRGEKILYVYSGWVVLGCRIKDNCPIVGFGALGGMPSAQVFLKDPNPYLSEFQRKS